MDNLKPADGLEVRQDECRGAPSARLYDRSLVIGGSSRAEPFLTWWHSIYYIRCPWESWTGNSWPCLIHIDRRGCLQNSEGRLALRRAGDRCFQQRLFQKRHVGCLFVLKRSSRWLGPPILEEGRIFIKNTLRRCWFTTIRIDPATTN